MHNLLHVPPQDNPTRPGLSAHAQRLLHLSSLLAVGTVDDCGQPWTTLLGGEPGFARSLGQSIVGVKALADYRYDPVLQILLDHQQGERIGDFQKASKDFSALGIHLASRDRVKLLGKSLASGKVGKGSENGQSGLIAGEVQMVFAVEGSLGRQTVDVRPTSPTDSV